jgi:predicted ester cyclase
VTERALVTEAVGLLWGGDEARVAAIVDAGYHDHAATGGGVGPDGFRAGRQAFRQAFADVEMTAHDLVVADRRAAVRLRFRGLHVGRYAGLEPCGRTVEWDEIHLWRLGGGRVVEHWACRDDLAALRRLGADLRWP